MGKDVKRVLVYRLGSLGDTVVAVPALHVVAKAFASAERRLVTNTPVDAKGPAAAAVLEGSGLVDGYFEYGVGMRGWGLVRLWWEIVRWRPEVLVHLGAERGVKAARRDAWFFRACGVRRMVGVPVTEGMQRHAVVDGELEGEWSRLLRNVGELGSGVCWDLGLSATELARAREMAGVGAFVAVSVGTKMQAKDWGLENWRELVGRVREEWPEMRVVMVGAVEEFAASEFVLGGAGLNLCGRLTVRESAAVLGMARLFVGHDSGPMHLAAAVGTRCVAVFSARSLPRLWFPFGSGHEVIYHQVECMGCRLETCLVEGKKCLVSIGVEEVVGAVGRVLGDG